MASNDSLPLLKCYHRGCGASYKETENNDKACTYHPGAPYFHDAYKGWSCCNKKSTDFTEFLNIKGCTLSSHSNEKPVEPEKPKTDKEDAETVVEYKAPVPKAMKRPPLETPLVRMKATVAAGLQEKASKLYENKVEASSPSTGNGTVVEGTPCKHRGCTATFTGDRYAVCRHHPGVPIFHEGMKYWSCCQKKTSDFGAFLEQKGCEQGEHLWIDDKKDTENIECRYDWHQTGPFVYIAIYAKNYDPEKSYVEVNPVRLKVYLYFPERDGHFAFDKELFGVIDVEKSSVSMLSVKTEIKLKKAEVLHWQKLEISKPVVEDPAANTETVNDAKNENDEVDLSDL